MPRLAASLQSSGFAGRCSRRDAKTRIFVLTVPTTVTGRSPKTHRGRTTGCFATRTKEIPRWFAAGESEDGAARAFLCKWRGPVGTSGWTTLRFEDGDWKMTKGLFWRVTAVTFLGLCLPWPNAVAQPLRPYATRLPRTDEPGLAQPTTFNLPPAESDSPRPLSLLDTLEPPRTPPRLAAETSANYEVEVAPETVPQPWIFNERRTYPNDGAHGEAYTENVCKDQRHCGWQFVFGSEETFLAPSRAGIDASVSVYSSADSFEASSLNSMEYGPRIWLGVQREKWQLLGQFWFLGGAENHVDPLMLGTGDTRGVIKCRDVRAFTVDAEVRRMFCCSEDWNLFLGFGFRFASLENTAHVTATGIDNVSPISAVVRTDAFAHTKFDAPGITFTVGGNRPIHAFCCSELDFIWNVRGSVVWGGIESAAQTGVSVLNPYAPGVSDAFHSAASTTDNTLFIGSFQTGLRWSHELKCAPASAFVQFAFEMQWWDADGGLAQTNSWARVQDIGGTAAAVAGPNVQLTLVGFTMGSGLTW